MPRNAATKVSYGASQVARFTSYDDAMAFGREKSRSGHLVEVSNRTGLIGQFERGKSTPEFAHNDRDYREPREPVTYASVLRGARTRFEATVKAIGFTDHADQIEDALNTAINEAIPIENALVLEVALSDLTLGFPESFDGSTDIYGVLRGSIRESLRNDLDDDLNEAKASESEVTEDA